MARKGDTRIAPPEESPMPRRPSVPARAPIVAAALLAAAGCACAQSGYPNRPVRMIVPYPPGAGTDFTAREVGHRLTEAWGQQIVVDNRPGAGATLGHGLGAKATPDGYTMLLGTTGGMVSGPAMGVKVSYDPQKDFAPIGIAVYVPYSLVVHASVPGNTVREFIDHARSIPGKLDFASPGTGTPNHLGGVLLMSLTGIRMQHVPYKGGGPALNDLLGGQVQVLIASLPQVLPHARVGRVKVLGVGHPTRLKSMPDLPAIAETVPGFNNTGWFGFFFPAGTPRAIVQQVNAVLNKGLVVPEAIKRFQAAGLEPATTTPDEFAALIRDDIRNWSRLIREAKIGVEQAP